MKSYIVRASISSKQHIILEMLVNDGYYRSVSDFVSKAIDRRLEDDMKIGKVVLIGETGEVMRSTRVHE